MIQSIACAWERVDPTELGIEHEPVTIETSTLGSHLTRIAPCVLS